MPPSAGSTTLYNRDDRSVPNRSTREGSSTSRPLDDRSLARPSIEHRSDYGADSRAVDDADYDISDDDADTGAERRANRRREHDFPMHAYASDSKKWPQMSI